jgi:hypothetical protein
MRNKRLFPRTELNYKYCRGVVSFLFHSGFGSDEIFRCGSGPSIQYSKANKIFLNKQPSLDLKAAIIGNFILQTEVFRLKILQHESIDMETLSRPPPPPPLPLICRLCPIRNGTQRCPPAKENLRWKGSNSISNFHHHNAKWGRCRLYITSQVEALHSAV